MSSIRNLSLFIFILSLSICFGLNSYSQELVTNGDFEEGNLTGWTTAVQSGSDSSCGYYRYTGTQSFWGNPIPAPPEGNHAVSSDTLEPTCSSAIFQDITVPSGAEVSCFLIYYYTNFGDEFVIGPGLDSSNLDNTNQQARIDILTEGAGAFSTGNDVLENLVQTEPGDSLKLDYTTLEFDLTDYAGSTVKLRAAQASNDGVILFAIDSVSCTVEDLGGEEEISSVPTLSEWGLISIAAILGTVGFIVMRRKKVAA